MSHKQLNINHWEQCASVNSENQSTFSKKFKTWWTQSKINQFLRVIWITSGWIIPCSVNMPRNQIPTKLHELVEINIYLVECPVDTLSALILEAKCCREEWFACQSTTINNQGNIKINNHNQRSTLNTTQWLVGKCLRQKKNILNLSSLESRYLCQEKYFKLDTYVLFNIE